MTPTADLKEFVAAYLVEAEEHLAVANAQLLAVESGPAVPLPMPKTAPLKPAQA